MSTSTQSHHRRSAYPTSDAPVYANFSSEKLTIGAGVAIFHIASERVVVCYHSRDKYWFLPKGRRNASEDTARAAEREGFEESGYRNRLLPLPIIHRQPYPDHLPQPDDPFDTEPVWTQLLPQSRTAQYILFWYAAETLSATVESAHPLPNVVPGEGAEQTGSEIVEPYVIPPTFPKSLTLRERIAEDVYVSDGGVRTLYEPKKYEGTGVDDEEMLYESHLLSIADARRKLKGSVMEDVVRRGWDAIVLRLKIEDDHTQVVTG